jgi:TonB family protein
MMPESWKECEGQVVGGEFQLLEHLGGSDHSVVFRTERGQGQRQRAAIKLVQADPASAELQLSRWRQAAQLSHPHLIKLFESGRCRLAEMDLLYVVMEFAAENLAEFLPQRALSPAETRDMLEPFLETLTYLHGQGLLHGRIKPGNILAIDDQLKLSSDSVCRAGEAPLSVTKPDVYTAPEFAKGESSQAGDVWALGVTLLEALTQRAPEHAASASENPGELQVPETLPQPFLDIARHSLHVEPRRRWSVAEVSARLNPAAKPPAPSVAAGMLDPVKPAAAKPSTAVPGSAVAALAKSSGSIDPLSIPLSPVPALPPAKQALQNQMIGGKHKSNKSYYVVMAVLVALTLGAMLAIPRFGSHQADNKDSTSAASSAPSQPTPQPSATVDANHGEASAPVNDQKQAGVSLDPSAQRPGKSKQNATQDSEPATADKQSVKKDQSAPASPAPASLRSAVPRSEAVPAAPFVSDREASIKAGAVTPGEVLNQILPEVSGKSRNTIRGTVRTVIKVHVDSSGTVSAAEIASAGSRFFANAALDAARQWDFAPAKVDGHAVPSEWLLHFDFTPTDTKVTPLATKP